MISPAKASRLANLIVFLIPLAILAGWSMHSDLLKTLFHASRTAMNPMSAVCFLILGLALLTTNLRIAQNQKWLAPLISAIPLLISLLHATSAIDVHVRLDELFFTAQLDGNKMPLHTCIGFVLASAAIIFFRVKGVNALTISPLLALAVGWLSLLAITGYLYGVDVLNNQSAYSPMAASTAITFLFFSVSLLLAKPHHEPTRTFISKSPAGRIARILVPLALYFPILSAWLRMTGENLDMFDAKLGSTIFALINIAVWASALWTTAHYLYRAEQKNKELMDFLDRNSKTDLLTSLWNRRYLEERLEVELSAMRRHGRIFSVLVVDIDLFKKVNDTFGHPAGDVVIRTVGQVLQSTARKADVVCRFGGEEFVILLPDTAETDAVKLAERMRLNVMNKKIEADQVCLSVTCSFGVAQAATDAKTVIEAADAHLYAAKQAGRNRVVGRSVKSAA